MYVGDSKQQQRETANKGKERPQTVTHSDSLVGYSIASAPQIARSGRPAPSPSFFSLRVDIAITKNDTRTMQTESRLAP
jgi:hypothetical protein